MAIEHARYTLVTSEPPCEIRDYETSLVALVTVDGSRADAVNAGFRVLANYTFGKNEPRSKIAMTAPVTQALQLPVPAGTSTPTTPPSGSWVVHFTMPAGYSLEALPAPTDNRVRFEALPAHRVATIRFSGFWSDSNLASHEAQLREWMKTRRLTPASVATYAYYDPPWVPWFMRTIEVQIDVAPKVSRR